MYKNLAWPADVLDCKVMVAACTWSHYIIWNGCVDGGFVCVWQLELELISEYINCTGNKNTSLRYVGM